ncbi:MAG: ATP-binding cassette domain-containing protein [Desulfovibrionaceae bacterium]|nr:ATP-binding cassette domain-containing protein [Desulfovibrionaceae bacterium]
MINCLTAEALAIQREKNGSCFHLLVPNLKVFFGQTLAVVGASGCGKSTLLDMLALILRPSSAQNFTMNTGLKNEDLLQASPSHLAQIRSLNIGYVLQSGGLFSFLNVEDNIMLPSRLLGEKENLLRKRVRDLAEKLGISNQLKKKPQHLSGGQRQRVAIARALVHKPVLVLADEPTAAVDQASAKDICAVFKTAVQEVGAALVMVSHDQTLMERIADSLVTFKVTHEGPNKVKSILTPWGAA